MKAKKKLSQHFLVDDSVAEQIAEVIDLNGKTVIEIGAGAGALTAFLAARAKRVIAVELDEELIPELQKLLSYYDNIEIVNADALKTELGGYDAVFGNIPYNISSPILVKLLKSRFNKAVLLLQKELAERLVAQPGEKNYSRLSVLAQNNARIKIVSEVPPTAFEPPPTVSSAVVLLEEKKQSQKKKLDDALVTALFQHKNQTLSNALKHSTASLKKSKNELKQASRKLSFNKKRVRSLSLEELEETSREWKKLSAKQ
ncbi:MAG: 16S rRNA (adenine(1518)-N(6)/adenine(1519)-N(6))-dimethyltransferase RsmA [Candidatus Micrarchaeia archaeon]